MSETGCEMTTQLDDVRLQRFARDPVQGLFITVAPVQEQLQALILLAAQGKLCPNTSHFSHSFFPRPLAFCSNTFDRNEDG